MSRNWQELNRLIGVWQNDEIDTKHGGYPSLPDWLVQNGVLAVDSLTDEELYHVIPTAFTREGANYSSAAKRAALRRCATGEAE